MAVQLKFPQRGELLKIPGAILGVAKAGIRKPNVNDVLVVYFKEGANVGGVFTQNQYCAAPVKVCRSHLHQTGGRIRALLVNTGCANAGTGERGFIDAESSCQVLAGFLGCLPEQVLPCSTGVILEHLPMDRFLSGVREAAMQVLSAYSSVDWLDAASSIMTTDTVPKAVSVSCLGMNITGIAKGAGMIRPNMATMLGFIVTDANLSAERLDVFSKEIANLSFNRITVDGDTSTNDTFLLMATGSNKTPILPGSDLENALRNAFLSVAKGLAEAIIRDAEGATKFIRICVENAQDEVEANKVAYSVAQSPLVKTAFFASDPNLGRILAAIGNSGVDALDVDRVDLYLDEVFVATHGGRHPDYREEEACRVMARPEITVRIDLKRGRVATTVLTSDLSKAYVDINASYRS